MDHVLLLAILLTVTVSGCQNDSDSSDNNRGGLGTSGAGNSSGGNGGGGTTDCQDGDIDIVVSRVVAVDAQECVDAYDRYSLGCGSPSIPIEVVSTGVYYQCWKDSENGAKVIAPIPLENLRNKANWVVCVVPDPPNAYAPPLPPCQKEDCTRHVGTLCTFEETCTELRCGDHESAYRQDGCERQKGSPCLSDSECSSSEICSLFSPASTGWFCSYEPRGSCTCWGDALGPSEQGWCSEL